MADTLQPCYVIEAALLTSPQPLTLEDLSRLFAGRLTQTELLEAMNELSEHWKERGLRLVETASGWGFVTSTAVGEYLLRMSDQKMPKYSRAVMETLAIIAYRQPATRGDIEDIRGVAVNPNVVRQLQERGWIEIVGHRSGRNPDHGRAPHGARGLKYRHAVLRGTFPRVAPHTGRVD